MTATIDYYFITPSPWAYLGHDAFHDLALRYGARIVYKPFDIMGVWKASGSVPVGQRSQTRQRYRRIELQRVREMRGLKLNVAPKHFPVDGELADRCVIALVAAGRDPASFIRRAHAGVWADEADIADRATLASYLEADGHPADAILAAARDAATTETLARNTSDAVAADAIGAPCYVLAGEPFWGQDRLDHLEFALKTGRQPYRS